MTNKLKYFIGNWKMFGDFDDFKIIRSINQFIEKDKNNSSKKIIMCVPNTLINNFQKRIVSKKIFLGVQNCNQYDGYGPHTGSVSAQMLKKAGAEYIILGHSENRLEEETYKIIKQKVNFSLKHKLKIIFCIGETLSEKRKNKTFSILKKQITKSLDKKINLKDIIIAYEPVWSIGSNKIPKREDLIKTINFIKRACKKNFKTKKTPHVLYGGSVNGSNIGLFSSVPEIDGFLIGGASHSSKKFIDIIRNYYK
jgi:triosephosphate isomerase (TIM)